MTPAEELVCAIIRGEVALSLPDDDGLKQVVEVAFHHHLQAILVDALKKTAAWNRWPIYLREKLQNEVVTAAALYLLSERELRKVLIALDENGIRPLLLKGVPLAYTVYQSSALRQRGDVDLLFRENDLQSVGGILRELGYDGPDPQTDKLTSYECLYRRKDSFGANHYLDIHWKINNAELFAKTFTFDELSADAIEIPGLAYCARGLGYTHALLLACMHRFGHAHAPFYVDGKPVYAGDHLQWVYDIHLLSSTLNNAQWSDFTTLARTKSIAEFCVDGLNAAKEAFNTQIPAEAMGALQTAARGEASSASKLRSSAVAWFFANLHALPDLRRRIVLIKQVALPPAAYMMEKYQTKNRFALPFLYGYRSVNGVFKRIKRSK
jgi:Uncharacterised nucleotidyltransferase